MQIQFTPNELQILTDTLERHNHDLLYEIARSDHRQYKHLLQQKLDLLASVQTQLATGDLQMSTESRDLLTEMLDQSERELYFEIARTHDREFKRMLQQNLEWLECAHYKINDARVAA